MSTIIQLAQGSPEWLAYRLAKRNASESAAVMGVSPWQTPYQLWLAKTGRATTKVTTAMRRGTDLEPAARAAYEDRTGLVMQPLVLEDGAYSASLDGMTLDGDLILEVKCPMRGTRSDLWQDVMAAKVPEHYVVQIQHQLMVSAAATAHLWVFDGNAGILHEIVRDNGLMQGIRTAWDGFQQYLDGDVPPPLSEADTVVRADLAWSAAAGIYAAVKREAEAAAERLEAARTALVALAVHPRETGAGVAVTRFWKAGNVDYKRVPGLQGVDLNAYRGKAREEVRITVE
jgi:putative phage-type endonuclease